MNKTIINNTSTLNTPNKKIKIQLFRLRLQILILRLVTNYYELVGNF